MSKHVLITPEICSCDKLSDSSCPVCDGGLAICSLCGKAEVELDQPCRPVHACNTNQQLITRLTEALTGLVAIFPERPVDDGSGSIGWKETVTKAYDDAQAALAAVAKECAS